MDENQTNVKCRTKQSKCGTNSEFLAVWNIAGLAMDSCCRVVVATIKFFPWAVLVAVLMAFVYVPIGPFAVIFAIIIAFAKRRMGL